MKMKAKNIIAGLFVGMTVIGSAVAAMSSEQQAQTEKVVHDYIIKNPAVVVESLQGYQQQQMDQARKSMEKTQQTASNFADALFRQATDPVGGNKNGKITVVEFFDYQCPHCIDMTPVVDAITQSNPNVRVVYKEFPIRGPVSETAAKAALAAQMQGKYVAFQHGLMNAKQLPLTEEIIFTTAKSVGLDVEKLKADMQSKQIAQQLKDTYKLAQDLKLMGTPALFVAKTDIAKGANADAVIFIPGQVNLQQLQEVIGKVSK